MMSINGLRLINQNWSKSLTLKLNLPCLALPCLALPCLALPCLALPCLALPCLALPCLALPCLALPYLTLPYLMQTFTKSRVNLVIHLEFNRASTVHHSCHTRLIRRLVQRTYVALNLQWVGQWGKIFRGNLYEASLVGYARQNTNQ
jgi:hypothetical protein